MKNVLQGLCRSWNSLVLGSALILAGLMVQGLGAGFDLAWAEATEATEPTEPTEATEATETTEAAEAAKAAPGAQASQNSQADHPTEKVESAVADDKGPVLWAVVRSEISPATLAFLDRVLREAKTQRPRALVIELDTPGGRLDSTLQIKDRFLDSDIPIWMLINRQALSAGAMMAVAAHEIHMIQGGIIGAATPVMGQTGEKASEKIVSAVRKAVAASAEARGRDPQVAEAMVDESLVIEGVIEAGKLLTLTAEEALEIGFIEGLHSSVRDFKAAKNIQAEQVQRMEPALAERLVQFFTHPVVASLLLTLGIWGLIAEIKSAGWGVGGTVSLVFLSLFFWSHHLAGLVGWEGIVLIVFGVLMILVEIFVTPGFGVPGLLGFLAVLGGLVLSLLGDPNFITAEDWNRVLLTLSLTGALSMMAIWASFRYLPQSRFLSRRGLVLATTLEGDVSSYQTGESQPAQVKVGMRGVARSDLRPSGVADLDHHRVTVLTEGEYVPAGSPIEVLSVFGNRVVVKEVKDSE